MRPSKKPVTSIEACIPETGNWFEHLGTKPLEEAVPGSKATKLAWMALVLSGINFCLCLYLWFALL